VLQLKESSNKDNGLKAYIDAHLGPNVQSIANQNRHELEFRVSADKGRNFADFF
jgi:hypothetical protein